MSRVARPNTERPTAGRGTGRGAGRGRAAATDAGPRAVARAATEAPTGPTPGHARIHGFGDLNDGARPAAPPRPPGAAAAAGGVGRVQTATGAAPLPENFTRAQDFISAVHDRYGPGGPEFNLPPPARQAPPATRPPVARAPGAATGPTATATRPGPYLTGTTVRGTGPGGRRVQDAPSPGRSVSAQRGFGKAGAKVGSKGRAAALEAAEARAQQAP